MPMRFRYKDNSSAIKRLLRINVRSALEDVGQYIAREANNNAPVGETGQLSQSYTHTVDMTDQSVHVGSPLNYAPYVELGTGPHYNQPPQWLINRAQRGHHDIDPWWYIGDDGEWHQGWFIRAKPHLRPAVMDNLSHIRDIFKDHLKNK